MYVLVKAKRRGEYYLLAKNRMQALSHLMMDDFQICDEFQGNAGGKAI